MVQMAELVKLLALPPGETLSAFNVLTAEDFQAKN